MKSSLGKLALCIIALTLFASHSPALNGGESLIVFEDNFDRRNTTPNELGNNWYIGFGLGAHKIHIQNRKAAFSLKNNLSADIGVRHNIELIDSDEDFVAQFDFAVAGIENTPPNYRLTYYMGKSKTDPFNLFDKCEVRVENNSVSIDIYDDAVLFGHASVDTHDLFDNTTYRLHLDTTGDQYAVTLIALDNPRPTVRFSCEIEQTIQIDRVQFHISNHNNESDDGSQDWTSGTIDNLTVQKH